MVALALCPGPYIGVKSQPINHVPIESGARNDVILLTNTCPPPHMRDADLPSRSRISPTQLAVAGVNCFDASLEIDRRSGNFWSATTVAESAADRVVIRRRNRLRHFA